MHTYAAIEIINICFQSRLLTLPPTPIPPKKIMGRKLCVHVRGGERGIFCRRLGEEHSNNLRRLSYFKNNVERDETLDVGFWWSPRLSMLVRGSPWVIEMVFVGNKPYYLAHNEPSHLDFWGANKHPLTFLVGDFQRHKWAIDAQFLLTWNVSWVPNYCLLFVLLSSYPVMDHSARYCANTEQKEPQTAHDRSTSLPLMVGSSYHT